MAKNCIRKKNMKKYIRKGVSERTDLTPEQVAEHTFTVKLVEEDTTIDTVYGDVLVTAGNYIITDHKGDKIGITPVDLQVQYDEVE